MLLLWKHLVQALTKVETEDAKFSEHEVWQAAWHRLERKALAKQESTKTIIRRADSREMNRGKDCSERFMERFEFASASRRASEHDAKRLVANSKGMRCHELEDAKTGIIYPHLASSQQRTPSPHRQTLGPTRDCHHLHVHLATRTCADTSPCHERSLHAPWSPRPLHSTPPHPQPSIHACHARGDRPPHAASPRAPG